MKSSKREGVSVSEGHFSNAVWNDCRERSGESQKQQLHHDELTRLGQESHFYDWDQQVTVCPELVQSAYKVTKISIQADDDARR